ncbi:MAG: glycosyltransferase family 39 protein [Candidatus Omnitrophota bacterium]
MYKFKRKHIFLFIFICALAVRLFYTIQLEKVFFSDALVMDESTYDNWAIRILEKDILTDSKPFWQAPFYPYFLALVYYIGGHNYLLVRFIQALLGLCNCLLIFNITKRIFGETTALIAFFATAFYGMFIFFGGQILNITLNLFLNLFLLFMLMKACRMQKASFFFYAGTIFGLSAITRPTILIFLPFLLLWLFWFLKETKLRRVCSFIANLLLGLILIISITALRNYIVSGQKVFISTYGGINFYIGNNPNYDQTVALQPGSQFAYLVNKPIREANIEDAKSKAASQFWYKKASEFIVTKPKSYLTLLLKKFYLFWNGFEIARYMDYYLIRKFIPFLKLPFISFRLISPLALCGIFICIKMILQSRFKYPNYLPLLLLFTFSNMLGVILYFVTSPYRIPVVACLIIFASFFIHEAARQLKNKNFKFLLTFFIIGATLGWITNSNLYQNLKVNEAFNDRLLCGSCMEKADYVSAISYCKSSVEKDPNVLESWFWLAEANLKSGHLQKAESTCRYSFTFVTETAGMHKLLGDILKARNLHKEAVIEYQKALRLNPDFIDAKEALLEINI